MKSIKVNAFGPANDRIETVQAIAGDVGVDFNMQHFAEIAAEVTNGTLKPVIGSTFFTAHAAQAHQRMEGAASFGKALMING